VAEHANRRAVAKAQLVVIAAVKDGIRALDGVGVVDHVAGPEVADEDDGGQLPAVDLLVEVALLLDDADIVGCK
jgi:hypothetical protein